MRLPNWLKLAFGQTVITDPKNREEVNGFLTIFIREVQDIIRGDGDAALKIVVIKDLLQTWIDANGLRPEECFTQKVDSKKTLYGLEVTK